MRIFRNASVKSRITLWYTAFIVLTVLFLVGALMLSQDISSHDYYEEQLRDSLNRSAEEISTMEDAKSIEQRLDSGVQVTVLSDGGELLVGRRDFKINPRENTLRIRNATDDDFWYLLDKPVVLQDGTRIWLRSYISSSVTERYLRTITTFLLFAIPVLLFISIFGGLLLTKRAFRPLDDIIQASSNIAATADLRQHFRTDEQSEEVARLADALDRMLLRLRESMENEKAFISDASHELKTPLSVISAQSEYALQPGRTPEEKENALKIIHARSVKTGRMLSQLLLLSRMDYEKLPLNMERVDLSVLLEQIALEMEKKARSRGIAIHLEIEKDVCVFCDELLIMRVISNLLENAVRYGKDGGNLWISLSSAPDSAAMRFRDDGIGISKEDQAKIWQRFYQVNKSGNQLAGFGLGLSIVHCIVAAHGGSVSVDSDPGKGSVFTVELPKGKAV